MQPTNDHDEETIVPPTTQPHPHEHDVEEEDTEGPQSMLLGEQQKSTRRKKAIIISVIIGIVALALILGLYFGLKGSSNGNPPYFNSALVYQRHLNPHDTFFYEKQITVCPQASDPVSQPNGICTWVFTNFFFHVLKAESERDVLPKSSSSGRIYTISLVLTSLIFKNETDTMNLGGRNILEDMNNQPNQTNNSRTLQSSNTSSSNRSGNSSNNNNSGSTNKTYPIVNFKMFDNGTVWMMWKQNDVNPYEWSQMKDIIEDFSPKLSKQLFQEEKTKLLVSESQSNETTSNPYYEASGNFLITPNFSKNDTSDSFHVIKTFNRDSYADIRLPDNSQTDHQSCAIFNKSTGHLHTTLTNSTVQLSQKPIPSAEMPDTDDYFLPPDQQRPKDQPNFANTNYFPNNNLKSLSSNSTSNMSLLTHVPNNRNVTEYLQNLSSQLSFDQINTTTPSLNTTNMESSLQWDAKLNKTVNKSRLLFDEASVMSLKSNFDEIVYPVYQTDFYGFKVRLLLILDVQPHQNSMTYKAQLTIGGILDVTIFHRSDYVDMAESIDKIVTWLFNAYNKVHALALKLADTLKLGLGKQIDSVLQEIRKALGLPFEIDKLFHLRLPEAVSEIINTIKVFVADLAKAIEDNVGVFVNPLEKQTSSFYSQLSGDVKLYLNGLVSMLQNLESEESLLISDLLSRIENITEPIFPDLGTDLTMLEQLVAEGLPALLSPLKDHIHLGFTNLMSNVVNSIESYMHKNFNALMNILKNCGFTPAIKNTITRTTGLIDTALGQMFKWVEEFESKLGQIFDEEKQFFDQVDSTAKSLVSTVQNELEKLKQVIISKTSIIPELKIFDDVFQNFSKIYNDYLQIRYMDFLKQSDITDIITDIENQAKNAVESFFNLAEPIENGINQMLRDLNAVIDGAIIDSMSTIKNLDSFIMTGLLSLDKGLFGVEYREFFRTLISGYFSVPLNNIYGATNDTLLQYIKKTVDAFKAATQSLGHVPIICDETVVAAKKVISSASGMLDRFKSDLFAFIQTQMTNFQNSIIQALNAPSMLAMINQFNQTNRLVADILRPYEQLFQFSEPKFLSVNLTLAFENLITNIMTDLTSFYDQYIKSPVEAQITKANSYINDFTTTIQSLNGQFIDCGVNHLTPSPSVPSFCAVYNIFTIPPNPTAAPLPEPCYFADLFTGFSQTLDSTKLFVAPDLTHYQSLMTSDLFKVSSSIQMFSQRLNNSSANVTRATSQDVAQTMGFAFQDLAAVENRLIGDFLYSQNKTTAAFANAINQAIDQLIGNYTSFVSLFDSMVAEITSVPDFLIFNLNEFLQAMNKDLPWFEQYLTDTAKWNFRSLMDKTMAMFQQINQINENYYTNLQGNLVANALSGTLGTALMQYRTNFQQIFNSFVNFKNSQIETFNNLLIVNYDDLNTKFKALTARLTQIQSSAIAKRENLSKNVSSSFEFNAYEKIKQIDNIFARFETPIFSLPEQYLANMERLTDIVISRSFDYLGSRYLEAKKRLSNDSKSAIQTLINDFTGLAQIGINSVSNFLSADPTLTQMVVDYGGVFNSSMTVQLNQFSQKLIQNLSLWSEDLKNFTKTTLVQNPKGVTNDLMRNYQNFQANMLNRVTGQFNNFLSTLSDQFFSQIGDFKSLIKADIEQKADLFMKNFTNGFNLNLRIVDGVIFNISNLVDDCKSLLIESIDSTIDDMFVSIFDRTKPFVDSLVSQILGLMSMAQNPLMIELMEVEKQLEIANTLFQIEQRERNASNLSVVVNGSGEIQFTNSYFNYLQNAMQKMDEMLKLVNTSYFISNDLKNLSSFAKLDFVSMKLNQTILRISSEIHRSQIAFNDTYNVLTPQYFDTILNTLFIDSLTSLIDPLQTMWFSDDLTRNTMHQISLIQNGSFDISIQILQGVNDYLTQLTNITAEGTMHAVLFLNTTLEELSSLDIIIKKKLSDFVDHLDGQLGDLNTYIGNRLYQGLAALNQTLFSNTSEGSILNKRFTNIIQSHVFNLSLEQSFVPFTGKWRDDIFNQTKTLIDNLKISFSPVTNTLSGLVTALKDKIKAGIAAFDPLNIIYTKIADNINLFRTLLLPNFFFSNDTTNLFSISQKTFEDAAHAFSNILISKINPLFGEFDQFLDQLQGNLTQFDVFPIIEEKLKKPIKMARDYITKQFKTVLDQIVLDIENMADSLIDDNSPAVVNNLMMRRRLEQFDIKELEDVVTLFHDVVHDAQSFLRTIPILHDVIEAYDVFRWIFDGGIGRLLNSIGDDIAIFVETCDHDTLDYLKNAVRVRIEHVDTIIKTELGILNNGLNNIVTMIKVYGWEALVDSLKQLLYDARGQLIAYLLSKIAKVGFSVPVLNLGDTYSYPLTMFIGPVPMTFEFSFSWALWFKIFFGVLDGASFGASFNLGASSQVLASAGIGLSWCQVRGYIKGVLAHVEANFNAGFNLLRLKLATSLCFSGEFGAVSVGVELYIHIHIDLWLFSIDFTIEKNFFGPYLIISPYTFMRCPLRKELG